MLTQASKCAEAPTLASALACSNAVTKSASLSFAAASSAFTTLTSASALTSTLRLQESSFRVDARTFFKWLDCVKQEGVVVGCGLWQVCGGRADVIGLE